MAHPTPYERQVDFSDEENRQVAGRSTVRTAALDAELDAIATTLARTLANLKILQRDDTRLADASVEPHTLSATVKVLIGGGWNPRGTWTTSTSYAVKDVVEDGGASYVCAVAHTSVDFAADHAAGYWIPISKTALAASSVTFASTSSIAATDVQAAIEEIDGELRTAVSLRMHRDYGGL